MKNKFSIGIRPFIAISFGIVFVCIIARWAVVLYDAEQRAAIVSQMQDFDVPFFVDAEKHIMQTEDLRHFAGGVFFAWSDKERELSFEKIEKIARRALDKHGATPYTEEIIRLVGEAERLSYLRGVVYTLDSSLVSISNDFFETFSVMAAFSRDLNEMTKVYTAFYQSKLSRINHNQSLNAVKLSFVDLYHSDLPYLEEIHDYCERVAIKNRDLQPTCTLQSDLIEQYSVITSEITDTKSLSYSLWKMIDADIDKLRANLHKETKEDLLQTVDRIVKFEDNSISGVQLIIVSTAMLFLLLALFYWNLVKPLCWIVHKVACVKSGSKASPAPSFHISELGNLSEVVKDLDSKLLGLSSTNIRLEEDSVEKGNLKSIMEAVFSVSIDGYYIWRPGEMLYQSPGIKRFLGFGSKVENSEIYSSITKDKTEDEIILYFDLTRGLGFQRNEEIFYLKSGHEIYCEVTSVPIKLDTGEFLLSYARDISLQKQHEADLRNARDAAGNNAAMKGAFLANMSHELRTPLNGVIGMAQLAEAESTCEKESRYLSKIVHSAKLLLRVINDILDFSKLESGKFTLEETPFSLGEISDQVESVISTLARQKKLEFDILVSEDLPSYYKGDSFRLVQVLLNICNNAIKFSERGTVSLIIRLESEESEKVNVLFIIQDTGVGMDQVHLANLFKPFVQADSTYVRKKEGTGLGLVISKYLVELMNGKIIVRSALGVGSTFSFVLPLKKIDKSEYDSYKNQETIEDEDSMFLGDKHILLAEDNIINQEVLLDMFGRIGLRVTLVGTGMAALEAVKKEVFDGIFMDVEMPVMDGVTATKLIRKIEGNSEENLPIIALTAHVLQDAVLQCRNAGMNDVLNKPIDIRELNTMCYKWLKDK